MPEERLWCTACGTVTRDQTCDCNRWDNEMSREPHFVNYADAMQEAAHEQAQELAEAVKLLHDLLGLVPGSGEAAFAFIERHMLADVGGSGTP